MLKELKYMASRGISISVSYIYGLDYAYIAPLSNSYLALENTSISMLQRPEILTEKVSKVYQYIWPNWNIWPYKVY